ncbi:amidase [Xanthobacter tagetidis]|uniref:Amidase n=1 Tax=Xanthobacter tagetidis TaxID=60216 RepID=A0A3L7AEQ4_9HYPH|nr:amidase [Xanthobacter tagetidis]MBB6309794.1 aspartyl-tRNA(Asn)/glutamyl-tRNA(Gln) amidotransferase subunit A [Xanthobacter tagetidis]RLP78178.1 amidase [Xanthobacter tagetidis]
MNPAGVLWRLSAAELAAAYAAGTADPVAALESCLGRLDAVNGALNAVVTLDADGARAAAAQSRARWQRGAPLSGLDGVPITVKDNLFVRGLRATWGSRLYSDHVAEEDDLPVARLRAVGAIIIGKTNTPELSLAGFTTNDVFGSTANPWDTRLSPGGSSGGAVAAVAGGIAPIAIATDAGGSTRRPASHAGCVGLKASVGRIARGAGFPALTSDLQTIGVIARTAGDVQAVMAIIAPAIAPPIAPAPPQDAAAPQVIGAFCDLPGWPLDGEVRRSYQQAIRRLESLGHRVREIPAPYDPDEVNRLFGTLAAAGVARTVRRFPDWRGRVTAPIAAMAETGLGLAATDYLDALDAVHAMRRSLMGVFEGLDLLLTPTAAALPWPREDAFPATIDGQAASPRASAVFTTFVNLAGFAAISVPAAPSASGLPIGIQLIGGAGSEERLIGLADALDRQSPWEKLAPL